MSAALLRLRTIARAAAEARLANAIAAQAALIETRARISDLKRSLCPRLGTIDAASLRAAADTALRLDEASAALVGPLGGRDAAISLAQARLTVGKTPDVVSRTRTMTRFVSG